MMNCPMSHGWKESDFHIDIYKTRQCSEKENCHFKNLDCPFWHSQSDKKAKKKHKQLEKLDNNKYLFKTPTKKYNYV